MRGLVMHGQLRLHFTKEQDSRRKAILDTIESLRPQVLIYDGSRRRHHRQRGECLRAHSEPLLAIPDAIVWCWQRGGHWKARVSAMISEVRVV